MQSVIEIIQSLARQRGRDPGPLLLLRQIDATLGERISHMPVESELSQAWLALAGEPFRPHQAQALMALRRGEPVALRASNPLIAHSVYLLLYAILLDTSFAALLIAPDQAAASAAHTALERINANLPQSLRRAVYIVGSQMRAYRGEQIVIATPAALHTRLLRHHDRAWSLLWPRVRVTVLLDVHRHTQIAAAHLTDILFRLQRIAAAHNAVHSPALLATLIDTADPQPALTALLGQPWKIVAGDDLPAEATTLAVWRGAKERLAEATTLAREIQRHGFHIHINCAPLDTLLLKQQLGDAEDITFGAHSAAAHVLVAAGAPSSHSELRRWLRSGYQAVVLVLGDTMREQMIARHTEALLSDPPTVWTAPPSNAYVSAQHILCAATESPLTEAEVDAWGVHNLVDRLVNSEQLVDLPDPEVAWKPTAKTGDPYAEFSLLSASGAAVVAYDERMQVVDQLDPTSFERWLFLNAALPSGAGGVRVTGRDEENGSVTLRADPNGRRTYPLRRCEVAVRDEHEQREVGGRQIGWGRVLVDEEVYGYREANAAGVTSEIALKPTLKSRWSAPACWFSFEVGFQQSAGQSVGWSLVAALPLRVLAALNDVVPCYDHAARRLYIVDAQPGGNGLASWLYAHAEQVLPLAYDVALACRSDALFEPLARADMDWLLTLLGRAEQPIVQLYDSHTPAAPRASIVPVPTQVTSARPRTEFVEGPPPTSDQRPATNDQRPATNDDRPSERSPVSRLSPPVSRDDDRPAAHDDQRATSEEPPNTSSSRVSPARGRPTPPRAAPPARNAPPRAQKPAPPVAPQKPAPPAAPQKPTPPAEESPDPSTLIKRLQRQRQQREAEQARRDSFAPAPHHRSPANAPTEARFRAGERIVCLPYGEGEVTQSTVDAEGHERLIVEFPAHGELQIDPAISLVRKVAPDADDEDDLL